MAGSSGQRTSDPPGRAVFSNLHSELQARLRVTQSTSDLLQRTPQDQQKSSTGRILQHSMSDPHPDYDSDEEDTHDYQMISDDEGSGEDLYLHAVEVMPGLYRSQGNQQGVSIPSKIPGDPRFQNVPVGAPKAPRAPVDRPVQTKQAPRPNPKPQPPIPCELKPRRQIPTEPSYQHPDPPEPRSPNPIPHDPKSQHAIPIGSKSQHSNLHDSRSHPVSHPNPQDPRSHSISHTNPHDHRTHPTPHINPHDPRSHPTPHNPKSQHPPKSATIGASTTAPHPQHGVSAQLKKEADELYQRLIIPDVKNREQLRHKEPDDVIKGGRKRSVDNFYTRFPSDEGNERTVNDLADQMEVIKGHQVKVKEEKVKVEKAIKERHARLTQLVDRMRDEALSSLNLVCEDIKGNAAKLLQQHEDSLRQLLDGGSGHTSSAPQRRIQPPHVTSPGVTSRRRKDVIQFYCPVLTTHVHDEDMMNAARRFTLTVSKVESSVASAAITVKEAFFCGRPGETGIRVFSICHSDEEPEGAVFVSYERRGLLHSDIPSDKFSETGRLLKHGATSGKVSFKRFAEGKNFCAVIKDAVIRTFAKSTVKTSGTPSHFRLDNESTGNAIVVRVKGTVQGQEVKHDTKPVCSIKVGAHRAFDVNSTGDMYIVVEIPRPPSIQRIVRMYLNSSQECICTYTPPEPLRTKFQPSDICFIRLGGRQVLLVCDEGNDVIHVVKAEREGRLTFLRYLLDPGALTLTRPTALNVGCQGRLWVACEEGRIFTVEGQGQ